ncbi:MAG: hypothetical protein JO097_04715 [Acidobacteriaceae bacterium]|nr:hypothetical protein [Acidobacteriaceae bacterium]
MGLALGKGYEPRRALGEMSFPQLGPPRLPFQRGVHAGIQGAEVLGRFYVRCDQLAWRLISEWGTPKTLHGRDAFDAIHGKTGVIFVKNGFRPHHGGRENHIDLWNGTQMGSWRKLDASEHTYRGLFAKADLIWFWELH